MKIIFVEVYDFDFFFIMLEVKAYYKFIFSNMSRFYIYRDDSAHTYLNCFPINYLLFYLKYILNNWQVKVI